MTILSHLASRCYSDSCSYVFLKILKVSYFYFSFSLTKEWMENIWGGSSCLMHAFILSSIHPFTLVFMLLFT